MAGYKRAPSRTRVLLDNPLEGEELLRETFFRPRAVEPQPARPVAPKPQHYKVVSISLYNEDIERLDRMVRELKRRGHYKANKSRLIRYALAQLDLAKVPTEDAELADAFGDDFPGAGRR